MKKVLIVLTASYFLLPIAYCQVTEMNKSLPAKSSIFFEAAGSGGALFSLNYDRILSILDNSYFNCNLGASYNPKLGKFNSVFGIPATINFTSGLKNHHLEIGTGLVYSYGFFESGILTYENLHLETTKNHSVMVSFRVGYKYQSLDGGLFFRLGFTPFCWLYISDKGYHPQRFIPGAGISIGYSPKVRKTIRP